MFIAAINLIQNQALIFNRFDNTSLLTDPIDLAVELDEVGFSELLVFDRDGAETGQFGAVDLVREMTGLVEADILVGGGLRDIKMIESVFDAGASRVLLNTLPTQDVEKMHTLVDAFGSNSFIIGLDINDEGLLTHGRSKNCGITVENLIAQYLDLGIQHFHLQILDDQKQKRPMAIEILAALKTINNRLEIIAGEGTSSLGLLDSILDSSASQVVIGDEFFTNEQMFLGLKQRMDQ